MRLPILRGFIFLFCLGTALPLFASPNEGLLARLSLTRPETLSTDEAEGLVFWLTHESLPIRAWAAQLLLTRDNAFQITTVWLLVHDPSPILQQAAFDYVQVECNPRTHLCVPLLRFLVDSPEPKIAAWARSALFQFEPERALRNAPASFVLDLLSQLSGELEGDRSDRLHTLLGRFNQHTDLKVRETAQRALNYLEP